MKLLRQCTTAMYERRIIYATRYTHRTTRNQEQLQNRRKVYVERDSNGSKYGIINQQTFKVAERIKNILKIHTYGPKRYACTEATTLTKVRYDNHN